MNPRDDARRSGSRLLGRWVVWTVAVATLSPGVVLAQPSTRAIKFHPDSSYTAESLLRNAAGHVREAQWGEAIEIFERVLRDFGGSMAQVPKDPADPLAGDSTRFVDVRQYCQGQLAAMPAEARALYRRRIDPEAERRYRQALAERSEPLLRRVVEEAFCSSWGDDAIDRLGDMAFQRGRFREALSLYEKLAPQSGAPDVGLTYPDPQVDPALVAAKILLCRAALGEEPPTAADLEEYGRRFPEAKGRLAGRNGVYAAAIAAALQADRLAPVVMPDGRWPTFGGAPSRTMVAPGTVDVGSFQWRVRLDPVEVSRDLPPHLIINRRFGTTAGLPPGRSDRELAYFPIVVGDQVVLAEAGRIVAYNLNDRPSAEAAAPGAPGAVAVAWDQPLNSGLSTRPARVMQASPRFTVTAHGDRIYARLGPSNARLGASFLLAVRNNREVEGKLLWKRSSNEIALPERKGAPNGRLGLSFEGTPVADDRSVYVALTESGTMTSAYVASLDAETGAVRWIRFLGEATSNLDPMMGFPFGEDSGNRLLTLDGPTVYYQTNLGAVAALEAETGAIRWLSTYPHTDRKSPSKRELSPAVAYGGLVLVAPEDAPEVFAFDGASGRLVWKSEKLDEAVHLLGVVKGRVVLTGTRVWLLDFKDGHTVSYWPQGGAGLEGYGRGLLAGDLVYWPTRTDIRVLDPTTGLEVSSGPIALQQAFGTGGGNLAVGDGYLVVAGADSLVVFCQNRRLIDRYREQIAAEPERALHYIRLARVAEATGQDDVAIEALELALSRIRPAEQFDGQPMLEMAQDQRYRLLARLGLRASEAADWDGAIRRYRAAASAARVDRDRLDAQLRLAHALERSDNPGAAVDLLQGLLVDQRLRNLSVPADLERSVRADRLLAERINDLLAAHGRGLYERYDRQARALLERGRQESNPHLLQEIGRSYPAAEIAPAALLALGTLHESAGRHGDAARAYKRLLGVARGDAVQARALLGLARASEAQKNWVEARDAYVQAQARFADLRLDGVEGTVGSLAAEHLAVAPLDVLAAESPLPNVSLPLRRLWSARWPGKARPLPAIGAPPGTATGRIFLAEGSTLRPIQTDTGQPGWSADLGAEPRWVAYLGDRVIAATEARISALDLATGKPVWTLEAGTRTQQDPPRNPFVHAEAPGPHPAVPEPVAGPLHDFRVVSGRVYCLRGDRELLAVDGDSGLLDWSYRPAAGTLHDRWLLDPVRVVVQRRGPNAVVVLDPETGRCRDEFAQAPDVEPWARDPWAVDADHVALVTDGRTVALFDLDRGVEVWSYREASALPRSGPPRLLGDTGLLLVLRDGSELVRLDPSNGQKLWSRVLGTEDLLETPQALALDSTRVYCACGPDAALTAYSLEDGEVLWQRHLSGPPTGWELTLTDRFLLAHPGPSRTRHDGLHALPLLLCRPDDGRPVQSLLLPAEVTDLAVRLAPGLALITTQEAGWALAPRGVMDVAEAHR